MNTYKFMLRSKRTQSQSILSEVEGCGHGGTSLAKLGMVRILSEDEEFDFAQDAFE